MNKKIGFFDAERPEVFDVLLALKSIYRKKGINLSFDLKRNVINLKKRGFDLKITVDSVHRDKSYRLLSRVRHKGGITPLGERRAYYDNGKVHFLKLLERRIDSILDSFEKTIYFELNKKDLVKPLKEIDDSFVT